MSTPAMYERKLAEIAALEARLAEAEAARLITRATLTDARRFVVMVCGETAPYAKIMLERIDKALADSQHRPADSAPAVRRCIYCDVPETEWSRVPLCCAPDGNGHIAPRVRSTVSEVQK